MELDVLKWTALIVASLAVMRVLRVLAYSVLAPWAEKRAAYKAAMAAAKVADRTERIRAKKDRREQRREAARQRRVDRTARGANALAAIGKGVNRMLERVGGITLYGWRAVSRGIGAMRRYLRVWVRVALLTRAEKAESRAEQRMWRRVEQSGRRVKATHRPQALAALRKLGATVVDRSTFRGDVFRSATVYRLRDQGEWLTATLVYEDGQFFWLPGGPKDDPQLEGFLVDRRAIQSLAAV